MQIRRTFVAYSIAGAMALAILFCGSAVGQNVTNIGPVQTKFMDQPAQSSAPPNPPSGKCRSYFDLASGLTKWINASGGNCAPSGSIPASVVQTNQANTYGSEQVQLFPVDTNFSDLVLGMTNTDPCCSLSTGSIWGNSSSLNGLAHVVWFDGQSDTPLLEPSDSVCNMVDGCTGQGQVVRQNNSTQTGGNYGDFSATSEKLNLQTGDLFDLQQGLTNPFIQATPQAGHIKTGYGSDNTFQASYNNDAFSPFLRVQNGTLPSGYVNNIVGTEVYNTASATQSGSLASTQMVATTPGATTWYRISFFLIQIAIGSGCSTNTTFKTNAIFTDGLTNTSQTVQVHAGAVVNNGTANTAIAPLSNSSGSYEFPAQASTSISYSVTFTGGTCTTTPTYKVAPLLERM